MAFFLKQTPLKGRTYLAIYESFYSREKKGTAHRTYKSLGSIETHKANGMDDPVSVFQKEVDELNRKKRSEGMKMISKKSSLLHLGYFPLKSLMEKLNIKKYVDYFKLDCTNFYFEIDREDDFRKKGPSKENRKDPIVGLGLLLDANQIPIGMDMYPGNESEKPVIRDVIGELKKRSNIVGKTIHVADKGLNCGQNIVFAKKSGVGYLFSKSVKTLPATEKDWVLLNNGYTVVRNKKGKELYRYKSCVDKFPYKVIHDGKKVTVKITEKRLVTYNPDLAAKKRYEINKMVDKALALTLSQAKKSDYGETGKYVNFTDGQGGKAKVSINEQAIKKDLTLAGYNLLVTSETQMKDTDIYDTYNNLWRIEESFRIMKSDLDARPVYVQKESAIKGHFLICYLTVLLERLFQFKSLNDAYGAPEIFNFLKSFRVTMADNKFINTTTDSDFIAHLAEKTELPLQNYYLSDSQIKSILNCRF